MAAAPVAGRAAARAAGGKAAGKGVAKPRQVVGPKRGQRVTPKLQEAIDEENGRLGLDGASAPKPAAEAPAPTSSGAGASAPSGGLFSPVQPSGAGGGLVLGALAYIVGLTYLRSGRAGVKALLKAKFLNEVS